MRNMTRLAALLWVFLSLSGCASFGDSLVSFNDKFDRFNQEYERQIFLQQEEARQRNTWGIVQSVRLVPGPLRIAGEPAPWVQELVVRMGGRSQDFRVVHVPMDSAPYRVGAVIYLR